MRLLIADDEPIIRAALNKILTDQHQLAVEIVGEAATGPEVLALAAKTEPQVVLLDIRLPGINGLKVAAKIKREQPDIRIIIISAYDEFDYAQEALRLGAEDYLLKPVNQEELLAVLARFFPDSVGTDRLTKQDIVAQALAVMSQHVPQSLNLETVAQACYVSPSYLSRLISAETGKTFVQNLTQMRLLKAGKLLKNTDYTIQVVATEVGFRNYSYFTRVFREEMGETPSDYRQRVRQDSAK